MEIDWNDDEKWYYHLTYNNAVLENYIDAIDFYKKIVYMPTYSQDADEYRYDRQIREILDYKAKLI